MPGQEQRQEHSMAARKSLKNDPCAVARSVDLLGDRWVLLIVRDALDGLRRFSEFQQSLGVARNILADRLRTMVDEGVLAAVPASDGSAYQDYVLTPKGRSLQTLISGLRRWGLQHLTDAPPSSDPPPPSVRASTRSTQR
jgi:DNA-binding HxlR family transcriptional regulator